jgi:hypothetical protein
LKQGESGFDLGTSAKMFVDGNNFGEVLYNPSGLIYSGA